MKNGEVVSIDGTHLGHNLPDRNGNRYCINLVSISGNKIVAKKADATATATTTTTTLAAENVTQDAAKAQLTSVSSEQPTATPLNEVYNISN